MKITAINASHRGDHGHTRFLIDRIFQGAQEAGAECEVVTLSRLKIGRCLACSQCQTEAHYLRCVQEDKDDVRQVFDTMARADILIYATPVYLYSMTGILKTLLDRLYGICDIADAKVSRSGLLHHHVNEAVCCKPFVTLVVCGNIEVETTKNVLSYFRTYARFMDAPHVGTLVRNAAGYLGTNGKPATNDHVRAVCAAYGQAGRELVTLEHIRATTQRRANAEIVPVLLFGLLRRLPVRPLKQIMAAEVRKAARTQR
jgi:multimeric flavodoxin WrbA